MGKIHKAENIVSASSIASGDNKVTLIKNIDGSYTSKDTTKQKI